MQSNPSAARHGLSAYLRGDLRADVIAGLTVAVMGVPQAMAYAMIAGLPPVYGLYTAIVTCAVAALLGSSKHLVSGPTNGMCMVMGTLTTKLSTTYTEIDDFELVLLLSFMTGAFQLSFGLLRMGGLVRYVSSSVVVGFTAGAGVLIAINQLQSTLGFRIPDDARRSYEVLAATVNLIGETNLHALGIAVATGLIVFFSPKINKRIPGALIGVALTGVISWSLGWHDSDAGVEIVKNIGKGIEGNLDIFRVPDFVTDPNLALVKDLGAGAMALAILGLIEATSISRVVARSSGQRLNFTREFVGQGGSKMVGSFFSCFAGSGSFTRTAVNYASGGRTKMAAVFSAVWTALALLVLAPVANYIPKAALAGMIIVIAYSMIDKERLKLSWRSGINSRIVLIGTLSSTLIIPLEWAIYVGVFLSLVVILRTTGKTDLTHLVPRHGGGFDEVPFNRAPPSPVLTVNMSGDIYFAAAEDLDAELLQCLTPETRVVVLRMKRVRAAGSTAMSMLEHYWSLLHKRRIYLVVCGIEKELEALMTDTGLRGKIGEENIFYADNKLFQSTELAMARAWAVAKRYQRVEERERREKRRQSGTQSGITSGVHESESENGRAVTAADIMTSRCIRFGNEHQTREAVWLLSELNKHTKAVSPEPLFLQDRDGKLFGELSPWRVLSALSAGSSESDSKELDDVAVAEFLRRDFTRSIAKIARTDVERCRTDTTLARMVEISARNDQHIIPICDDEGRVKGLVTADDLLRGLGQVLAACEPDSEGSEEASDG